MELAVSLLRGQPAGRRRVLGVERDVRGFVEEHLLEVGATGLRIARVDVHGPVARTAGDELPVPRCAVNGADVRPAGPDVGVWGAMERKVRLATAVSGVSERPELAPSDRFRYGERVASQQVDVLVAER